MKKIYFLLLLATSFYACEKKEVDAPSLEITLEKTSYAKNEPVVFNFNGTADIVTFYSGLPGKEYKFRDRIKVDGVPQMTFTSYRQPAGPADTTLRVFTSTNFKGVYSADYIYGAKWTDITGRAKLSTGTDNTVSGTIDLSDVSTLDSAVYIAFLYSAPKNTAASQPTWTIKNISVDNVIEAGPPEQKVNVKTMATMTWNAVSLLNSANNWVSSTSSLQMVGAPANAEPNTDWIISQPLELKRVPRDLGVNIKTSVKQKLSKYEFTGFTAAGTYTVTFEIVNVNKFDTKTTIKEFVITVE